MFEIAGIDHLVLRTTNLEAMLDFYIKVLGCSIERETPEEVGLTQLRAGNALIDLVVIGSRLGNMGGGAPTNTENNLDHFCLQIKPVAEEELVKHLTDSGIEPPDFAERYGAQGFGNSVYIKDPDQNTVELRIQI